MKTIAPHTPIQYVIGQTRFCDLDFLVDERVLIPRPETEMLVEAAMEIARKPGPGHLSALDLGTGSGNVAVSLMIQLCAEGLTKFVPKCKIVASDISEAALDVARLNARRHGVLDRIEFIKSDLFENIKDRFDIIIANPPYVAGWEFETLQKEVLREPRIALDGGADGLDFYRSIITASCGYLKSGGHLIMEIGFGQCGCISRIIKETSTLKLEEVKKDWNGIERVVIIKLDG